MSDFWIGVLASVVGTIVFLALNRLRSSLSFALVRHDPRLLSRSFAVIPGFWLLLNTALACYVAIWDRSSLLLIAVFFISSMVAFLLLWRELHAFWVLGIRGADRQIVGGIDYRRSLRLCRNEFAFLGIGAAKLTEAKEFEEAVCRCRPDKPIRLLLCEPTDDNLTIAAARFEKPKDQYQKIVIGSLRKIAELKQRRGINIEVRFHSLNPLIFRLLFIDSSLCLLSYYILGEGDGSQLPQLHVVAAPQSNRAVTSFYYPLELHFETLWESSKHDIWDFESHL